MAKKVFSIILFSISSIVFLFLFYMLSSTYIGLYIGAKEIANGGGDSLGQGLGTVAVIMLLITYGYIGLGSVTIVNIISTILYRVRKNFRWDGYMSTLVAMIFIPVITAVVFTFLIANVNSMNESTSEATALLINLIPLMEQK